MSRHSLRSLSDQQILSRIESLSRRERAITLLVLLHLNEIERRRLHLKSGFSSMFDYCTSELGYSASAASRRIRTARCVRLYPEIQELLKANEVNISTVAQVSRVLTHENRGAVLARIRGKSQREVEAVVAEFEPRDTAPRDRVRTVVVRVPAPPPPLAALSSAEDASNTTRVARFHLSESLPSQTAHNGNDCTSNAQTVGPADRENTTEQSATLQRRITLQFSASEAFMTKLEKVRSLAWHRLPANASLEQVFEFALDLVIERSDPAQRHERRQSRTRKASSRGAGEQKERGSTTRLRESVAAQPKPMRGNYRPPRATKCTYETVDSVRSWGTPDDGAHRPAHYKSTTSNRWHLVVTEPMRICACSAPITIASRQSGAWAATMSDRSTETS